MSLYLNKYQEKITNLEIWRYFLKVFTEMTSHVRRFVDFRPNDQCYGDNRGIVWYNGPILRTSVYIRMGNNVAEQSFQLYYTKRPFCLFRVRKMVFFVKHIPKICCILGSHHFCKISDHMLSTNNQKFVCVSLFIHLS